MPDIPELPSRESLQSVSSVEHLLFSMRKIVDGLKGRAEWAKYKYAEDTQSRAVAHFLERGTQLGEAAYRIHNLLIPLDVLMRVLCDDVIRLYWVSISPTNAEEYSKAPVSELAKMVRNNLNKGHARVFDSRTGAEAGFEEIKPHIDSVITSKKSLESIADDCGLGKLYNIVFRFASLAVHGNTFGLSLYEETEDNMALRTNMAAINAFLLAITRIVDTYPEPQMSPVEFERILFFGMK